MLREAALAGGTIRKRSGDGAKGLRVSLFECRDGGDDVENVTTRWFA
jgi:hypothetical protein